MTRIRPFQHMGLKLLALGLGVLLRLVVSGEAMVERWLTVPLELQQFPPNLELQTKPPSTVDVRVRGGSDTFSRLTTADIVAVLDLHGAAPGQRFFHLTPDRVRVPFGVEIVQITPATVAMVFENSATRLVSVVPAHDGQPAPGFVVGRVRSHPEQVEIVGPESSVKRAEPALTEPLSVSGSRKTVRGMVTVGMPDSTLRLKTTRSVEVEVEIVPAPFERIVRSLPVHWRQLPPNLTAQFVPATVDVTVRGDRDAVDRIGADEVSAYVDLSGVGAGEYARPVHAESTRNAGVTRIQPPTVQVRITRDKD